MRRLEVAAAGIALAVLAVGLPLLPLQSATFTRVLTARYSEAGPAGLSAPQAQSRAEKVRAFVVAGRGQLEQADGFDADAVAHLLDVRRLLRGARVATSVLAAVAVGWLLLRRRSRDGRILTARALVVAGWLVAVSAAVLVATGLVDFDALFSAFHQLFFAQGTWTFPADSMLIRLFPQPFWVIAASGWASLTLLLSIVYVVLGSRMKRDADLASR